MITQFYVTLKCREMARHFSFEIKGLVVLSPKQDVVLFDDTTGVVSRQVFDPFHQIQYVNLEDLPCGSRSSFDIDCEGLIANGWEEET